MYITPKIQDSHRFGPHDYIGGRKDRPICNPTPHEPDQIILLIRSLYENFNYYLTYYVNIDTVHADSHVVLGLSLPMNDHQLKWFKRAISDEILLHSLLLYAAKHNEILTGASREVEIYCHRGEVMRIVNERIGSGREKLVDTTIDAVACLVLFEV